MRSIGSHKDLLDAYYPRVLGIAYQTLGDAALAAQAAETCFKRVAKARTVDVVEIWRILLDILHSYILRGLVVQPLASEAIGWQATMIDGLGRLDVDDRLVLLLSYHERLDHAQLAEVLRKPVTEVREAVARARFRLMQVLELDDAMH